MNMTNINIYKDREHIPVPKYKPGDIVYTTNTNSCCVNANLIRACNMPLWNELTGCWIVSYRYQDMIGGRPFGRMHSEYTLDETDIYPTEEEAYMALANEFIAKVTRQARDIAVSMKRLGVSSNHIKFLADKMGGHEGQ